MICISTVKIRARPWGGIYKQMIWLRFGKVSVRLFCREYKRKRGTDSTSVATLSRDPGKDLIKTVPVRFFAQPLTILKQTVVPKAMNYFPYCFPHPRTVCTMKCAAVKKSSYHYL